MRSQRGSKKGAHASTTSLFLRLTDPTSLKAKEEEESLKAAFRRTWRSFLLARGAASNLEVIKYVERGERSSLFEGSVFICTWH